MIPKEVQADSVTQEHKNYNIMTKKEINQIKKTGQQIKDALNRLFLVMVDLEANDETGEYPAFLIDYDTQDMFHAASIMNMVCSNYAIKKGILTEENAERKVSDVRISLKEAYGLDTMVEAQKQAMINESQAEA